MNDFISNSLEHVIEEITADGKITPKEYITLRELADDKYEKLIQELGKHNKFTAFQKSMDVSMQLLQECILEVKKNNSIGPLGRAIIGDAFKAQIEYLELGGKLFLDSLLRDLCDIGT